MASQDISYSSFSSASPRFRRSSLSLAMLLCGLVSLRAQATNAPGSFAATPLSSSQVSLTWTDNSSNETGFTFAYDTNSALSGATYVYAGGVNTTSYTHTGRSAATTYFYKIKAEGNPDSSWTSVDSATTAPSGLTVAATSNSAIGISWTGNSGNSSIQGYTYALATNSSFTGASYNWVSGNGTVSTSKTGLATATTYWLKIKAEGTSDTYDSPYGSVVTVTTMPGSLAATVVSTTQVNLSWSGNSGNSNITGYTVATATNSSFTGATYEYVYGAGSTGFNKTGLTSGTTYYFKVKAEGTSDSYDSGFTAFVTATPGSSAIPSAPSGLSATAVAGSRVDLSWTDNSGNETGFELKRATDSAFTQNVIWIGNIQGTTYSNLGLTASTTYYYKVRAEGTAGKSAYSSTVSATTPGPPAAGGIPPHFFGVNAWMPARIGNQNKGGDLDEHWQDIQDSGVKIMRYGGIAVDRIQDDLSPNWTEVHNQYLAMVDNMRSRGIEPVLQVPYWGGTYTATQAAALVSFVNGAPNSRGVKYWSIGNEPDLDKTPYPYKPVTTAKIAGYIRSFSAAMKNADPTIRILGPELTWGNPDLLDPLTTCNGTGDDITGLIPNTTLYYVDVISFHAYHGFGGEQSRGDVVGQLAPSGGFQQRLGALKTRLSGCHNRTGANAILIAVTETNAGHQNTNDYESSADIGGVDAKSFLGGQMWAETLGVCMQQGVDFVTFWSVVEGDELGYIGHDSGAKRPSYHHFQMMAKNFRGSVVTATDNRDNVKVFAAKDTDQVAVILLNQEESTDLSYTVRLDTSTIATSTLRVNVNAAMTGEASGTIDRQSTIVLIFDAGGALRKKIEYKRYGGGAPTGTIY
jgi:hypothetical protein